MQVSLHHVAQTDTCTRTAGATQAGVAWQFCGANTCAHTLLAIVHTQATHKRASNHVLLSHADTDFYDFVAIDDAAAVFAGTATGDRFDTITLMDRCHCQNNTVSEKERNLGVIAASSITFMGFRNSSFVGNNGANIAVQTNAVATFSNPSMQVCGPPFSQLQSQASWLSHSCTPLRGRMRNLCAYR